jgi:hypothetical protein
MFSRLLVVLLFFAGSPALAADPSGRWALSTGDTTLMLFEVLHTPRGWAGTWQRPEHFESDGDSFSRVTGPKTRRNAHSARAIPGGIELTFDDPRPGATPDIFVIRPRNAVSADLSFVGFGSEPATLNRVDGAVKLGPWDSGRTYVRITDRPTDPEMTAIFDADQEARSHPESIDWKAMGAADDMRRVRTQALLDAGRLRSADDFYHAAFVFQHGHEPGDYLKAHALALVAAGRGKPAATWIAAATLDRYLQSIGQPQVYGTQFHNKGGTWTQGPYQQNLLSDALREASRVPSLRDQEVQRLNFEKQFKGSKR